MSRLTNAVTKFRDVVFGTKYSSFKCVQNESKPCTVQELADAVGQAAVKGVVNVDNVIMRADGTAGALQKSLATISDAGTVNIPAGQSYTINGVSVLSSVTPTTGTAAPNTTPVRVGAIYVNTAAQTVYFAKGTTDANDWVRIMNYAVVPVISSGTSAPATTPGKVGDIYIDTASAGKLYFAKGTTDANDWVAAN